MAKRIYRERTEQNRKLSERGCMEKYSSSDDSKDSPWSTEIILFQGCLPLVPREIVVCSQFSRNPSNFPYNFFIECEI